MSPALPAGLEVELFSERECVTPPYAECVANIG